MISALELGWAAGFLEGEGCFGHPVRMSGKRHPRVSATQKQLEPLERLVRLFGGSLHPHGQRSTCEWVLSTHRSVQVMMTLYALMSPIRKIQIADALIDWKAYTSRISKDSPICSKGHEFTPENTYRFGPRNTFKSCRKCHAEYEMARKIRVRSEA